ncbi:MAG: DUF445 domain-containing protein [Verrucomicrobiota bacterium JB023]|nr:DUF445 domain-containing protein [Verrucomicrobiota bacterium JB023]
MTDKERLQRMRWIATGLLMAMAFTYAASRTLEAGAEGWGWVRAFAEAAMVGALADWFAVTALFRHPLGLPIPHTAIVRKEKRRIGASLARFVRGSFLTREEVGRQWAEWKPVERFAKWLSREDNASGAVRRVAGWFPVIFEKANADEFSAAAASRVREGMRSFPVGRFATVLLGGFLRSPSRRAVMAPLLGRLGRAVSENRDWVMEEARKGAPMRGAKVLGAVTEVVSMVMSGKAVQKLADELITASGDEEHVLFEKIEEALGETLKELEAGGGGEWESFKLRVLDDPETQAVIKEVIRGAGRYVLAEARELETGEGSTPWAEVLVRAANRLLDDPEQLQSLERQIEEAVSGLLDRYGEGVEELIIKTVDGWEADDLIERLENQVGPDLQFIRINGTIIGGTVGLLLHAFEALIWG